MLSKADFDSRGFKAVLHRRVTDFYGFLHDRQDDIDEVLKSWNVLDGSNSDVSSPDSTSWTDVSADHLTSGSSCVSM